jgi:hypothetical protein
MKKLLFALLLLPSLTFGKGVDLGFNIGYNSLAFATNTPAFPSTGQSKETATGIYGSVKLMNNISKHSQFGVGVDVGFLKQPVDIVIVGAKGVVLQKTTDDQMLAKPYIHPQLIQSIVMPVDFFSFYIGPSIGLMFAWQEKFEPNYGPRAPWEKYYTTEKLFNVGFTAGIHAGFSFSMDNNVFLNVEASPRTINFNGSYLIPVSVGLRFRFN